MKVKQQQQSLFLSKVVVVKIEFMLAAAVDLGEH